MRFLRTLEVVLALPLGPSSLFSLEGGVPSSVLGLRSLPVPPQPAPRAEGSSTGPGLLQPLPLPQKLELALGLLLNRVSSLQHPQFPAGLEVTDEVLEKAAGTDINDM